MQKLVSRTSRTIAQAERRRAKKQQLEQWLERKYYEAQMKGKRDMDRKSAKAMRKQVKEDWLMGPLAPNRAYGVNADTYGAFRQQEIAAPEKPKHMKRTEWPIIQGDRVVIIRGHNKGMITKVKSVNKEQDALSVEDVNQGYLAVEEWQRKADGDNRTLREHDLPIPYDDVKLVHTIEEPKKVKNEKGETVILKRRDVIVEKLDLEYQIEGPHKRKVIDPETGEFKISRRTIPGTDIELPAPRESSKTHTDHQSDTLRIDVEDKTFIPTLLIPPMPESVIDEVRGKYSKFRTRHSEEFLEKVSAMDKEGERLQQLSLRMRTPRQELHALKMEEKAKRPERQLTDNMLARIGEVMLAGKPAKQPKKVEVEQ